MAKYKHGIIGPFYGKIGKVIGSSWRGVNYVRTKPAKNVPKPTPAQKEQRSRFRLGARFCYSMAEVMEIGFQNEPAPKSPQNHALSHFMKNAIIGDYPGFRIYYPGILVSHGQLPNVLNPVVAVSGDILSITWEDNSRYGIAKATDPIMIVIYHKTSDKYKFELGNVTRSAKAAQVNVAEFGSKLFHVWISATSKKGKETANSIYLGKFSRRAIQT